MMFHDLLAPPSRWLIDACLLGSGPDHWTHTPESEAPPCGGPSTRCGARRQPDMSRDPGCRGSTEAAEAAACAARAGPPASTAPRPLLVPPSRTALDLHK